MADKDLAQEKGCFKEAVCIDAMRIYDSCSDKDCIEDTRVLFTKCVQDIVDTATNVRIKDVKVITVFLDLQSIPFNRGFYSVDMTFFFDVALELFTSPLMPPTCVNGVSVFNKKVILYGSEGNVKVFTSDDCEDDCKGIYAVPRAVVQVAEPIALSAKICDSRCYHGCGDNCCAIPDRICRQYGGDFEFHPQKNSIYATIGMFIIVQIVRNAQMLIPAYDFCVPDKECITSSDNPCEIFQQIDFPVHEFFPPAATESRCDEKNK
ncbi:MAG: hypothetical protein RSC76_03460 [Oscillospiraceae bacterium]